MTAKNVEKGKLIESIQELVDCAKNKTSIIMDTYNKLQVFPASIILHWQAHHVFKLIKEKHLYQSIKKKVDVFKKDNLGSHYVKLRKEKRNGRNSKTKTKHS